MLNYGLEILQPLSAITKIVSHLAGKATVHLQPIRIKTHIRTSKYKAVKVVRHKSLIFKCYQTAVGHNHESWLDKKESMSADFRGSSSHFKSVLNNSESHEMQVTSVTICLHQ